MDSFDPYLSWLGIPSQLRPLNHYLLLGVKIYENDPEKIALAYETRMVLLKQFQSGPRGEISQQLITQVGKAKRDLLDPDRRARYDSGLKKQLEVRQYQLDQTKDETLAAPPGKAAQDLPAQSSDSFLGAVEVGNSDISIPNEQVFRSLPSEDADDLDEAASSFWFLRDVRYLVGLLALSVLAMTATVKILAPKRQQAEQAGAALPASPDSIEAHPQIIPNAVPANDPKPSLQIIQQAADGTFELAPERAYFDGDLKSSPEGISNWSISDQVAWTLDVIDPRTGFFNCKITYQAKSECGFEVQLGDRKPRQFTLYPHEEDFEEEFIIRLARTKSTSTQQTLRLTAKESASGVQIKRILLVPNR